MVSLIPVKYQQFDKKKSDRLSGRSIWNDGIKEYTVFKNESPDSSWVKGKIVDVDKEKYVLWNDGIRNYFVYPNTIKESHWIKGRIPNKKIKYISLAVSIYSNKNL